MLHLVSRRLQTRSFSPSVCGALHAIRATHVAEEEKLNPAERLEFADALLVLAMGLLLESGIRAHAVTE